MKPRYFLMRHGDAGPSYPDEAADRARHLTKLGEYQVKAKAGAMADKKHQPSCVYSDDSNRCIETAQIMADSLGIETSVDPRLADVSTAKQAIDDLTVAGMRPLLVTHDHVIGKLTGDYTGEDWPTCAEVRRMKGKKERGRY